MDPSPGHLIHIGYAKAGSSFLQRWFAAHPELAYVEGGIAGFSTVWEIAAQSAAPGPPPRYRVTSAEALASPTELAGFAGHRTADPPDDPERQATVCAELARLFPSARILLVTRGFRSVLLSGYSQHVRTGGTLDFGLTEGTTPGLEFAFDYDHLVRIYGAAFEDRLTVMPYELLRDDPDGFIRALEQRLGLSHADVAVGVVNPALSGVELRWYLRLNRLVMRVPLPGRRLKPRLLNRYVSLVNHNRLSPLVRVLQALHPLPPLDSSRISDGMLAQFRGRAESLRDDPLYAAYGSDYLFESAGA
jgi:hypothetical protein